MDKPSIPQLLEQLLGHPDWQVKQYIAGRLNLSTAPVKGIRLWLTVESVKTADGAPVNPAMMRLGSNERKLRIDPASGRLDREPKAPAKPKREPILI